MRVLLASAVLVVLLGTCAACAGGEPSSTTPGDDPVVRPGPAASLTISYSDGEGDTRRATLRCSPGADRVTGYLRLERAPDLCRRLVELTGLLTGPPPRGRACAEVYGGPQTARISGGLEGRDVDRRFARTDACEVDDWERLGPLLPDA